MTKKTVFVAVDRTLRDIRSHFPGSATHFGGVPIVLGGDFQQILPVVRHGDRAAIVLASLQYAKVWPHLDHLILSENMRLANQDSANRSFAEWLSRLSHDEELFGHITLPADIYQTASNSDFIDSIYPADQLLRAHQNPDFFIGRAILTPRNTKVEELNAILLDRMEGELHSFNSHDEADLNDNAHGREELTAEFLHSLRVPNLPIAHLQLRISAPVMLMRNLDPKYGLCNGTRMTITKVSRRCLEVRINGGDFDGQSRLIFRCALSTSEELHFTLTRTQFPIQLAFAMTINKSQGQSLHHVGVDLRSPVFTHGQLYVALSRTTDVRGLSVLFSLKNENRSTDNIVYPEVLQSFSPRE